MYVLRKKQIVFMCLCLVFSVAYFYFKENETMPTSSTPVTSHTVVLDAGHGLPDGGAVNNDGVSEESINLKIVFKLQELLESSNCAVVLTRSDENGIYDADSSNKKVSDLKNRVEIINNSDADILVSGEKYYGWQSFYQPQNEQSKNLASFIQTNLNYYIDRDNQRTILPLSHIYIMDNSQIPAVTIECGFLSNQEDAALLQTDEYQNNIAWGIYAGIMDYFK
jgi:N-acetylmuramoyl-L-alanine amidase